MNTLHICTVYTYVQYTHRLYVVTYAHVYTITFNNTLLSTLIETMFNIFIISSFICYTMFLFLDIQNYFGKEGRVATGKSENVLFHASAHLSDLNKICSRGKLLIKNSYYLLRLFASRTFSVIGLCPAGAQRCGVPAGFAGVEKGEEGDEVRAPRPEHRASATLTRTPLTQAYFLTPFLAPRHD